MLSAIFEEIKIERARQDAKWGEQNHDNFTWCAILMEEVGEAAQAALHDQFGGSHKGTLLIELIHVAAVTVQWIECLQRSKMRIENDSH